MESKKRRSNAPLENESKRRKVECEAEILRKLKKLEKSVESLKDEVKKVLTEDYRRPTRLIFKNLTAVRPTPVNLEEPDLSYLDPIVLPRLIIVRNLHSNTSVRNVQTFFKGFHIKVSNVKFKQSEKEGVKDCFVTLEPGKHTEAMALNGKFMRISRDSGSHVFMSSTMTPSVFTVFVRIGSKSGNYTHEDMRTAIKTHFKNDYCEVLNIFVPQKQSLIAYALLRAKDGGMLAKFCALRERTSLRKDEEGREDEGYRASVGRFEIFVRSATLKKKFFESDGLDVKSFLK
uniref:RRM domain-containing protein n=1 Tax=Noccaea caerulescens TaxID=107243 RepID=A0A1J3IWL0_NOCCA